MIRQATPRLAAYSAIAAVTMLIGVAARRPELAVIGLPFAVLVACGLATTAPVAVETAVSWSDPVILHGEDTDLVVTIAGSPSYRLEVDVRLPPELEALDPPASVAMARHDTDPDRLVVPVHARRWGALRPRVSVRAYDAFRLFGWRGDVTAVPALRVHPETEHLRDLVRPERLLALAGGHLARTRAEGVEYADARPFVTGDRMRAVNWRVSARRDELWVGDRHPDRNGDVVVFLDLFADVGDRLESTLDLAARAVVALSRAHLGANDRVGLVGLGGLLRWIPTGMGDRQLHAIADAVLDTEVVLSDAPKGIDVIPLRGLPPRALVIGLSPLVDRRAIALFGELCGRGYDLVVVECAPEPYATPGRGRAAPLALRLWTMERLAIRDQLVGAGAAVVPWHRDRPFAEIVEQVRIWRRAPRRVAR